MTEEGARDRIAKLLAIYKDRPHTPEGQNALKHAERMIEKYKLQHPKAAAASAVATHPEVARVFSAIKTLLTTKPVPMSKQTPDFATLERLFMNLMRQRR